MKGKAADYHMLVRMIREIKVPRDRFGCVLVVFLYVTKVFSESDFSESEVTLPENLPLSD